MSGADSLASSLHRGMSVSGRALLQAHAPACKKRHAQRMHATARTRKCLLG